MTDLDALHWNHALFPTPDQFRRELQHLYLLAEPYYDSLPLPTEVLASLLKAITKIYAKEFPAEYIPLPRHRRKLENHFRAYELALQAFLKSLVNLTRHFPYRYPMGEAPQPALMVDFYFYYTSESRQAFEAFVEPFKNEGARQLADAGVFDFSDFIPFAWYSFSESEPHFDEPEPIYGDQFERRAWRVRKKQFEDTTLRSWRERQKHWEKENKVAHELREWDPTFNTPYYSQVLFPLMKVPFAIPYRGHESDPRFSGTWIIGTHNSGKTNLLRNLILEDLKTDDCIILMDSKGDLLRSFIHYRPALERMVLIRPHPDHPIALNPLRAATDTVGLLEYIFGTLAGADAGLSGNMTVIFRNVLDLLQYVPNSTILDFQHVLQFGWKKYADALPKVRDPDFFYYRFDAAGYTPTKQAVAARIDRVTSNDVMRGILTSPSTELNISQLMDEGKFILVDNREGLLGTEGCEFLGRFIIALVLDAARQRTMRSTRLRPCHLIIDECHKVIRNDPHISDIITGRRSQLISLTVAHQQITDQLEPHVLNALKNCAIKFVNAEEDRMELARSFPTAPENLRQDSGIFFTYVRRITDGTPVYSTHLPVDDGSKQLTGYPLTTDDEFAAFERQMWTQYYYTPEPRKAWERPPGPAKQEPRNGPPRQDRSQRRHSGVDTDPSGEW